MGFKQSTVAENSLLTIGQVSQLTQIPIYTLRYWERELPGILTPLRTPGGQRRYDQDALQVVYRIKELVKERMYTLAGAKRIMKEKKRDD